MENSLNNYAVLLQNGSIKMVSSVKKGDALMGPGGETRVVESMEICEGAAFGIVPLKGDAFVLGEDNYLCLSKVGQRDCFLDIHICDFEKQSEHFKKNHKLYRSGIEFFPYEHPILDPYFLGVLLGDACLRTVPIKLTNPENEIIDYVVKVSNAMGLTTNVVKIGKANCFNTFIGSNRKRNNILRENLSNLGLWGKLSHQKFIPEMYKFGSKDTRSEILAGLIDTDGTLTNSNSVQFDTTSSRLAEDVCFVARSLGLGCSIGHPRKRFETWKACYTLCLYGDFKDIPIKIDRKTPNVRRTTRNVLKTGFEIIRLKNPSIYYKLEFNEADQHYLKSDFIVMKGGNKYVL